MIIHLFSEDKNLILVCSFHSKVLMMVVKSLWFSFRTERPFISKGIVIFVKVFLLFMCGAGGVDVMRCTELYIRSLTKKNPFVLELRASSVKFLFLDLNSASRHMVVV